MNKIKLSKITKCYDKNIPVIKDLDLNIVDSSFTVLLGPSGCGKSTILRMIAGLEKETSGDIYIDERNVSNVEPGERKIAMVFQNYALYPTMTVKDNIEFGLKNIRLSRKEIDERVNEISEVVDIKEYLQRKPANLSGGQRQRVALARAIVKKPHVFLMDEPLSNLDAKLRTQIRGELIELHNKLQATFVYVTHDQQEAMSMATHIILLDKGKIAQQGTPLEIYANPANLFTARFIGSPPMNVLPVKELNGYDIPIPSSATFVAFRPEKCQIYSESIYSTGQMVQFKGSLITREILGDHTTYKIKLGEDNIHIKSFTSQFVDYGDVIATIDYKNMMFFDKNELRIYN